MTKILFALSAAVFFHLSPAHADQILVLSGGAAPMANHYSQYLQTKTLSDNLKLQRPQTEVTTFFGAGNAEGQKPVLADVHRSVKTAGGLNVESLLPGFINGNSPATQEGVANYFAQPKLSQMKKSETLFVFVSDHGMPQVLADGSMDSTFSDNCIDLWAFNADLSTEKYQMGTPQDRCLSQGKLKKLFDSRVSAGRVVFAMSQCYSGGFHKMSVKEASGYPTAEARVCGFTAITEDTTASGCTADVDGPGYQGYERSFTEQLTGVDVVSGRKLREPKSSILDAHRAAALEDKAKDIPLGTSDFFLWKWALAIEDKNFRPRGSGLVTAAQAQAVLEAATVGQNSLNDADYKSKEKFVAQMSDVFAQLYPQFASSFKGSISSLRELQANLASQLQLKEIELSQIGNTYGSAEVALISRWSSFVRSGASKLSPLETQIELGFFTALNSQYGYGAGDQTALINLSMMTITRPLDAEALSDYKSKRFQHALDWALNSGDAKLSSLARNLMNVRGQYERQSEEYGDILNAEGHARRMLIYRQVLGAWQALAKMEDTRALEELKALNSCESASLK